MKNVGLFGAGDIGRRVFEVLGPQIVRFFFTNNRKEKVFCDMPVLTFEEFLPLKDEVYVIVTSIQYADEMSAQLLQNGISYYLIWDAAMVEMFSPGSLSVFPRYSPIYCGDEWGGGSLPISKVFFSARLFAL